MNKELIIKLLDSNIEVDILLGLEYLKSSPIKDIKEILDEEGEVKDDKDDVSYILRRYKPVKIEDTYTVISSGKHLLISDDICYYIETTQEVLKRWGWKKYE